MEQVAPAVATSTDVAARGPVTRFFTPPGSEADFVLYATPVRGDLALAALFTMDTPLGNARRSGQALVQAIVRAGLSEPPAEAPAEAAAPPVEPPVEPPPLPRDWVPERPSEELERVILPAPETPSPAMAPGPSIPVALPRDWIPAAAASEERFPFLQPPPPTAAPAMGRDVAVPFPLASAAAQLRFSLVLVPRFPEHRLTGGMIEPLRTWVHRLCLAWDWRLEHIEVQPDRLALTLDLGPEVAPALAVQQLRDGLASRLLQAFPQLAADLPSGRFWASPFLLTSGPLPAAREITEFIQDTRRAQGFKPRA
jgi:REP element-mobilizing transposase RayT